MNECECGTCKDCTLQMLREDLEVATRRKTNTINKGEKIRQGREVAKIVRTITDTERGYI